MNKAFIGLQKIQLFSASHAIRYEGYSVRKVRKRKKKGKR